MRIHIIAVLLLIICFVRVPFAYAQEVSSAGIVNTITNIFGLFLTNEPFQPGSSSSNNAMAVDVATTITSYRDLFVEIGGKVGVPPRILEGIMLIESPEMYKNFDAAQIALYSQPGNILPNCTPNFCSAIGPMQMTIGIDNTGSSLCRTCSLTKCPNAWASYGTAVNKYGGSHHQPSSCNLRDNIYSAAAKMRTDSGVVSSANWTKDQVYRVAEKYYGSCGSNYTHSFQRIGYPVKTTYCEALWWYYSLE